METILLLVVIALVAGAVMFFSLHKLGAVHRKECLLRKEVGRQ